MRRTLLYAAITSFEDDMADGELEATCYTSTHALWPG